MSWTRLGLVTDADLGVIEPQATVAAKPWGAASWPDQRAEAKNDLAIWLERDHPDVPGVTDRVIDTWNPAYVLGYTGSAYTDLTSEASNDTEEDIDLATTLATFGTDRIYVGAAWEFDGVWINLLDSINATASVMTVKYWADAQWTDLTATDRTKASGATLATSGRVTWTIPSDWVRRKLSNTSEEFFWVEISLSAAPDAGTAATQILPIHAPAALKRCAAWLALSHIMNGLAVQAPEPDRWQAKADNYLDMAKALWKETRVPLDLNVSGGVDDSEVVSAQGPVRFARG